MIARRLVSFFNDALPAIAETWHMGLGKGWILEVNLNFLVCLFIVGGRLGRLFAVNPKSNEAAAQIG